MKKACLILLMFFLTCGYAYAEELDLLGEWYMVPADCLNAVIEHGIITYGEDPLIEQQISYSVADDNHSIVCTLKTTFKNGGMEKTREENMSGFINKIGDDISVVFFENNSFVKTLLTLECYLVQPACDTSSTGNACTIMGGSASTILFTSDTMYKKGVLSSKISSAREYLYNDQTIYLISEDQSSYEKIVLSPICNGVILAKEAFGYPVNMEETESATDYLLIRSSYLH